MKTLMYLFAAAGMVILQGCAATDPLLNANDWNPIGVNAENIAAQVADPVDLVHGRDSPDGSDGQLAAAAIVRLRTDHVKPLPDNDITDLKVQTSSSPGAGGAGSP